MLTASATTRGGDCSVDERRFATLCARADHRRRLGGVRGFLEDRVPVDDDGVEAEHNRRLRDLRQDLIVPPAGVIGAGPHVQATPKFAAIP
jgi:hypothetical protein